MKTKLSTIALLSILCLVLFTFFSCDTNNSTQKQTPMSENEWNAMLDKSNFENFTTTYTSKSTITSLNGVGKVTSEDTAVMKFSAGKVHNTQSGNYDGHEYTSETSLEGEEAEELRLSFTQQIAALKYEFFDYDPETNVYKANQTIEVPIKNIYVDIVDGEEVKTEETVTVLWENVVVEISNGKLYKISFITNTTDEKFHLTSTSSECVYIISDYGTTK